MGPPRPTATGKVPCWCGSSCHITVGKAGSRSTSAMAGSLLNVVSGLSEYQLSFAPAVGLGNRALTYMVRSISMSICDLVLAVSPPCS
jgi:hypothetical protein